MRISNIHVFIVIKFRKTSWHAHEKMILFRLKSCLHYAYSLSILLVDFAQEQQHKNSKIIIAHLNFMETNEYSLAANKLHLFRCMVWIVRLIRAHQNTYHMLKKINKPEPNILCLYIKHVFYWMQIMKLFYLIFNWHLFWLYLGCRETFQYRDITAM